MIDLAALRMVLMALTGWLHHHEREALAYLIQENRILRQQLCGRRLRLTDEERRGLGVRAYRVGHATSINGRERSPAIRNELYRFDAYT